MNKIKLNVQMLCMHIVGLIFVDIASRSSVFSIY